SLVPSNATHWFRAATARRNGMNSVLRSRAGRAASARSWELARGGGMAPRPPEKPTPVRGRSPLLQGFVGAGSVRRLGAFPLVRSYLGSATSMAGRAARPSVGCGTLGREGGSAGNDGIERREVP